jgi:menaquinone-specific isochorismate synthase
VVAAGPVQHLATTVEGRLSSPVPSVLELVAALHPTPAVGGWPRDAALALQRQLEQADRGRYAGPVGWVDAAGNGAFAVGIRSVELSGNHGRVFAGVGVVADSDPLAELDETRAKSQAVLSALART